MASEKYKRYSVLISSTVSFTVCFMVWMMLAVVGIPVKEELGLTETQFSILAALPVLSGSLIRVPLGIWTDKYGGRIVMFVLMMVSVPAIFLMGYAYAYWHFLLIGLMMGLAGGTFSVGTPYVARWFPKEQQGLAMGVFGAGNAGSAVNKFLAPALIAYGTWHFVPTVYAAIMLGTALLFWFTSYHDPKHLVSSSVSLKEQFALLKDPGVLRYSQYYSVVFGGYGVGYRPVGQRGRTAGRLLFAARRRTARVRRLPFRQVRRIPRDLGGDVGAVGMFLPALLSANRFHHPR